MTPKDDREEIFVAMTMPKMVSLDHKSVISMMIQKYKDGRCIIPVKFFISDINVSKSRLELVLSPLESFSLDQVTIERPD